ncbi:hypothetical protein BHE74_00044902 [Ensete ventricosum]|nr:hypothetical protein BHE74_00044902 [Ensete ventricosum]
MGGDGRDKALRRVVGLGFLVQGFRCFPWMGVNFFLKDGLGLSPSSLQILQNSSNLPMVAKPLYGILSDALYLAGQHRLPYVAIGGALSLFSLSAFFFPFSFYPCLSETAILAPCWILITIGTEDQSNSVVSVEHISSNRVGALSRRFQLFLDRAG